MEERVGLGGYDREWVWDVGFDSRWKCWGELGGTEGRELEVAG